MPQRIRISYPPNEPLVQFNSRLPAALKARVVAGAVEHKRSVQTEVAELLRLGMSAREAGGE